MSKLPPEHDHGDQVGDYVEVALSGVLAFYRPGGGLRQERDLHGHIGTARVLAIDPGGKVLGAKDDHTIYLLEFVLGPFRGWRTVVIRQYTDLRPAGLLDTIAFEVDGAT